MIEDLKEGGREPGDSWGNSTPGSGNSQGKVSTMKRFSHWHRSVLETFHTTAVNSHTLAVGTVLSPTLKVRKLLLREITRFARFTQQMHAKGRQP